MVEKQPSELLRQNTDRITKGQAELVLEAYYGCLTAPPAHYTWKEHRRTTSGAVVLGHYFTTKRTAHDYGVQGMVGFRSPHAAESADALKRQADLVAKLLLALTGQYYRQVREARGLIAELDITALMDAVGYTRAPHGKGHDPKNRRSLLQALRTIDNFYLSVLYTREDGTVPLTGRAWHFQVLDKDKQEINWDAPEIARLEFYPGAWRVEWERDNWYPYDIDKRFMSLQVGDEGRLPILLGLMLILDGGINRAKGGKRHTIDTMYYWAGLRGKYGQNPARKRQKLASALDALKAARLIKDYRLLPPVSKDGDWHVGIDFLHHVPDCACPPM